MQQLTLKVTFHTFLAHNDGWFNKGCVISNLLQTRSNYTPGSRISGYVTTLILKVNNKNTEQIIIVSTLPVWVDVLRCVYFLFLLDDRESTPHCFWVFDWDVLENSVHQHLLFNWTHFQHKMFFLGFVLFLFQSLLFSTESSMLLLNLWRDEIVKGSLQSMIRWNEPAGRFHRRENTVVISRGTTKMNKKD